MAFEEVLAKCYNFRMKVKVGTANPRKVEAVQDGFKEYPEYATAEIEGVNVSSGVSSQPKSLEETIQGAMNRAKGAFQNCDLGVGLESGIFPVPNTKSGYMDICMCAIYDGKNFHLGGSSVFEYPKILIDLVLSKGIEIDEAAREAGFTDSDKIGKEKGMIGHLTKGYIDRRAYSKQAVITALIHLQNPEHY